MIAERDIISPFFRSVLPLSHNYIPCLSISLFPNKPTGIGSYHLIPVRVFSYPSKVFEPGLENFLHGPPATPIMVCCAVSFALLPY